jgi:hypothetical protein
MTEDKLKRGFGGGLQPIDFSDLARQIEQAKKKNRILKQSMAGLVALALVIGAFLFNHFVWRYAVIEDLQVNQRQGDWKMVDFKFKVQKSGIVRRGYEKAVSEDIVIEGHTVRPEWRWYVDPAKTDFSVYVRSRWGFIPTWETKIFPVSGPR